jgi:peptide/nickel transport system permease protein
MFRWLSARVGQTALLLLTLSVMLFVALHAIGNPVDLLLSPGADEADRQRFLAEFHLDAPLWRQYLYFAQGVVHGDLGNSFVYNLPALYLIFNRLPATLELAASALIIAVVMGLPAGLYCGLRPRSRWARAISGFSVLGFSVPTFWAGILLIMVFSVHTGWLPSSGRGMTATHCGITSSLFTLDGIRHLALPAFNLSLFQTALILRLTRAKVVETLPLDYVRVARAQGLKPYEIVRLHVLKPIAVPVLTAVALEFGGTLAFSVVTETVFAWPGTGKLVIDSINLVDRPVVVAYLLLMAVMFVLLNLFVDVAYHLLDPRLREARD